MADTVDKLEEKMKDMNMEFMEINSIKELVLFSGINPIVGVDSSEQEIKVIFFVQDKSGNNIGVIVSVGNESANANGKVDAEQYISGIKDKIDDFKNAQKVITGLLQFCYERFNASVTDKVRKYITSNKEKILQLVRESYSKHYESVEEFYDAFLDALDLGYGKKKQQSVTEQSEKQENPTAEALMEKPLPA